MKFSKTIFTLRAIGIILILLSICGLIFSAYLYSEIQSEQLLSKLEALFFWVFVYAIQPTAIAIICFLIANFIKETKDKS